jgi:hypothetical protein
MVIRTLNDNVALAKQALERIAAAELPPSDAHRALASAIITPAALVPGKLKRDLAPIIGKYMPLEKKRRAAKRKT